MDAKKAMLRRRSCRKFSSDRVNDDDIKSILEAAMAAPSAINQQPWEFYVVKNPQMVSDIKNICPAWQRNAPMLILVCGDTTRFIKGKEEFWLEDCGAAIENMLLEATNLGLGSLWCGVYPGKDRIDAVAQLLNLPNTHIPYGIVHIGYPDEKLDSRTQYDEKKIHYIL